MSGGSYDYACFCITSSIIMAYITHEALEQFLSKLSGVLIACEWYRSCDWEIENVISALDKFSDEELEQLKEHIRIDNITNINYKAYKSINEVKCKSIMILEDNIDRLSPIHQERIRLILRRLKNLSRCITLALIQKLQSSISSDDDQE